MGARSPIHEVDQPFPVVFDAFVKALPTKKFRITGIDRDRGHIRLRTRNHDLVVAVGAVDAITTEWVASSEQRFAVVPDRHERNFAAIEAALDDYLTAYYGDATSWSAS